MTSEADSASESKGVRARVEELVARTGVGAPRVPILPAGQLPMPNLFLAASVFGMAPVNAPPVMVNRAPLEAAPGYTVRYTGRLLHQGHADLVMALIALAGGCDGTSLRVRACDLERALVHGSGRRNRESLEVLLGDISAAHLSVRSESTRVFGTLLPFGREDLATGVYQLELNPKLMTLAHGGLTVVDLDVRRKLARKPMAQWLQLYTGWLRAEGRRAVELGELQRVARSAMEPRQIRFYARKALDELATAGAPAWELAPDDVLHAA
jgi:hypothetical protein